MSISRSIPRAPSRGALGSVLRRLGAALAILLVIAWLTLFGLILAERGRQGLPAQPLNAGLQALSQTAAYLVNHPATYRWHRMDVSALGLVLTLLSRSAGLLLLSLAIAALVGVPVGIAVAQLRRLRAAPAVLLLSVLGISTPSFLLAMLFLVVNVQVYRWLGTESAPLPPTGFGWDAHLLMPALVLAMRPLAQIVQVTYVSMSNVLTEDYIRTAQAKGLAGRTVLGRHALRNILIPVLTTLGTSMRFSLASLPVVEAFFVWPGVGQALLQAIEARMSVLVTDLILSLGFLFLLINQGLEVVYLIVDPRVRASDRGEERQEERVAWRVRLGEWRDALVEWWNLYLRPFRQKFPEIFKLHRHHPQLPPLPGALTVTLDQALPASRSPLWMLRSIFSNPALILGTLLVLSLCGLALWGEQLTPASPYATHGMMTIEGQTLTPPFAPSKVFPWGADAVGRDIQALVLAGAKQTMTLALLGMAARMLLGTLLGILAGWWRGGWLDRLINATVAVWAAFPVTLFAMILILALGIQQGISVFVVTLCIVGWGEIAQFVRGQVIGLKPQLYIEAARSVGAGMGRILTRHMLPHLWAPLLVLAALETGSILMLLAELGFLNIFLGGGFKAEIGEVGRMQPVIYYFSDTPEWGALLANIRNWWRSYPWLAWYPGVAFFLAILAFNLWGEGLRRFLEDTRLNIGRVINRYTVTASCIVVVGLVWLIRSTTPIEMYGAQAQQFDARRAMQDIQTLASPAFQGRESGMPGAKLAADYIAAQMQEIGLLPAGEGGSFLYGISALHAHQTGIPRIEILSDAQVVESLTYRQDFVEHAGSYPSHEAEEKQGVIVGLAIGPDSGDSAPFSLRTLDLRDKVILVNKADFKCPSSSDPKLQGVVIVNDDPGILERRYLFPPTSGAYFYCWVPMMYVTPQAADRLLATAGSSLAQLDELSRGLEPGKVALTQPGTRVRLAIPLAPDDLDEKYEFVMGFIPGTGAQMGEKERGEVFGEDTVKGLDSNVIIISAYYDGLGVGPEGTLYPGANDNASGVAAMLEMARVLKATSSQPKKTIMFVAWSGGERQEGLSVTYAMRAKRGFHLLTVEAVIELSGIGAGSGSGIALGPGTSFSLVKLFQDAAGRVGVPVTTRGRGPHFGLDTLSGFGGRTALSAYVSWDGSDQTAHTAADTPEAIDLDKLKQVGQTTLLVVSVLGQAEPQKSTMGPLAPPTSYIQGARMFDEAQAIQHIEYLAGDELEGRRTGTPGGRAAGDYVAARFAEYGLHPAGADGTYFQPFTVVYTNIVTAPVLSAVLPATGLESGATLTRTYVAHEDYWPRINVYMGSGEATGPVVWLNECKAGDFAAAPDLAGKVILCYQSNLTDYAQIVEQAPKRQAGGVMIAVERTGSFPHSAFADPFTATVPIFVLNEPVVLDLLTGTGYTFDALRQQPVITPLSTTVHMAMGVASRVVEARNVLGLLPGADPAHKDEYVIIGAHYDHLGRDPDGTIYNGANVNASGVAAMLEIARVWQAQGYRPARNVLFVAWDDSTQGWWGAKYYVQNAPYPLDKTVATLNLEMVGRGQDVTIVGREAMADQLDASARVYSATVKYFPVVLWGDALPFFQAQVPSAMLMSVQDPFDDPNYHRPTDDAESTQPGNLRATGVLAAHTLAAWAGGGPTRPLPPDGTTRYVWDLILPTPTCPAWPLGSMTCDHGKWAR
jgi:peptide/nickel transport system permease protein